MTEDNLIELSRRKTLGAIGSIGLASAGAGLGTSAYFSDTESFDGNQLTAGELDLLVDWEEHYSDWSEDEGTRGENVWMPGDSGIPSDAVPVPTAEDPMLYVAAGHLSTFMAETAIDAFPDTDTNGGTADDGLQDAIPIDNECGYIRQYLQEGGGWISPLNSTARTNGTVNGQTTEPGDKLVQISDVKPGDFGEVTFSLHLCDNPGYIWVNGELGENLENGLTEPEAEDPDEDHAGPKSGELGDEIQTMLWYDTGGDGTYQGSATGEEGDNIQQADERILLQGGLNTVMDVLGRFEPGIPLDADTTTGDVSVPPAPGSGVTVGPGNADGIDALLCEREDGNPSCSDHGLLRAIKLEDDQLTTGAYTTPAGAVTVDSINVDAGTVTLSTDFPVSAVITKGGPTATVCKADGDTDDTPLEDGDAVTLDEVTFQTPLNSRSPAEGDFYGLSHVSVCYEPGDPGDGGNGDRECFPNSTTAYVGFAWWLPVDHANEIQTDSVDFDLGFYTEQCRHNDGDGMAPERLLTLTGDSPQGQGAGFANPWDTTSDFAHRGNGAWGTVDHSADHSSYKQGFYFGGQYSDSDVLPEFTVSEIEEISYRLYEPTPLDGVDIYLSIYTQPEDDGDDAASWYDSRLQALPSEANGGSPNFTASQWNEFSTSGGASNTLTWSDTGRGGNFVQPLPTLDDIQAGPVNWTDYGANLSTSHDYRDEEVLALSLQTGSQSGVDLVAYIDDVTVRLTNGAELVLDLEP